MLTWTLRPDMDYFSLTINKELLNWAMIVQALRTTTCKWNLMKLKSSAAQRTPTFKYRDSLENGKNSLPAIYLTQG